jgi:hypothetical protein
MYKWSEKSFTLLKRLKQFEFVFSCGLPLFSNYQQTHGEIDLASEQLTTILSAFFETSTFINSEILWACLVDPIHDTLIVESLDTKLQGVSLSPDKSKGTELRFVMDMKRGILDHLIAMLQHGTTLEALHISDTSLLNDENSVIVRHSHASQCLRLCAYLSLNLPRQKRRNTSEVSYHVLLPRSSTLSEHNDSQYFQIVEDRCFHARHFIGVDGGIFSTCLCHHG